MLATFYKPIGHGPVTMPTRPTLKQEVWKVKRSGNEREEIRIIRSLLPGWLSMVL